MTEYRIDDLARASGTTTRNIRGYQERGLLPRPLRRGRTAIYNDWHLRQLRAINRLLNEGFTLKHITKFLSGLQQGAELADVLDLSDLEGLLEQRFSNSPQGKLSLSELEELLGPIEPAALERLIEAALLEPVDGSNLYLVTDLTTIDNFSALISLGMKVIDLADIHAQTNEKLDDAARVLIGAARDEVARQRGPSWVPSTDDELDWATKLIGAMRRAATHTSHAAMNRALDDALRVEMRQYRERAQLPPATSLTDK
ncbi:MerR family transcriptional regulator [Mycobacteroides abscessus]|nr:MerR family transcriptional regulator [Mycobacteroides abscessus]MDM1905917.1 MerR family transcriptional regulator [Mycobacteroides abscessus]MDM1910684.1 MerR family transcriptional regulator [Mycobacteroides abscessus]MDM1919328.1 MerR family transcriptional regulator [Mycobacteroides abscessus]